MKRRLTPKTIDALPPSKGKRYEVRDNLLPGLHIRVSRTGSKVWYLATRIDDRARRIKLGAYPVLSPSDARERAQGILRDVTLGKYAEDSAGPSERSVPSVREAIDAFIDKYAKRNTKDWRGTQRVLLRLTKLHKLPLDQVTTELTAEDVVFTYNLYLNGRPIAGRTTCPTCHASS